MIRRVPLKWALVVFLAVAAVVAGYVIAPRAPVGRDLRGRPGRVEPSRSGPVRPPAVGALIGAWVRPDVLSQTGRLAAVQEFEQGIGRRLDIVTTYRRFADRFPTRSDRAFVAAGATLMLSWSVDDLPGVASGAQDWEIHNWAARMRRLGGPILLRFRWEMDRPNLGGSVGTPADYVAAWRRVRAIFAAESVHNVSWVWCPTAAGFAGGYAPSYYPGDDQVDWLCVDVYASARYLHLAELLGPFLRWAAVHPKPIVIGEFGISRAWGEPARVAWLRDAARLFRDRPQIKAVCYFDSDPDGTMPGQQYQLGGSPLRAFADLAGAPYFNTAHR
jgi:hypothetical protein